MSGMFIAIEGPNGVGKTTVATLLATRLRQHVDVPAERSRLELTGSPHQELALYQEAWNFLRRHDWEQVMVDCRGKTPEQIVAHMLKQLDKVAT